MRNYSCLMDFFSRFQTLDLLKIDLGNDFFYFLSMKLSQPHDSSYKFNMLV